MRFQVPQFIEIEDKIFGPLTLKQFIYIAGGGGLSFLIYISLDNLILSIPPILIIMGISTIFAFYRINNKPFVAILESAFYYYLGTKLYIWKKQPPQNQNKKMTQADDAKKYASIMVPKISNSKLKDLTWSLDIKESIYSNKNQQ